MDRASLELVRATGAGRGASPLTTGLALGLALSKRAAIDAVFVGEAGRTVCCVDEDTFRVGEVGGSGVAVVPRVVSHAGGLLAASLVFEWRKGECVGVGVSPAGFRGELFGVAAVGFKAELVGVAAEGVAPEGFSGELVGVDGLAAEGECASGVLGRRNGEVRGLLKDSGDGLYGVGVVDCFCISHYMLEIPRETIP